MIGLYWPTYEQMSQFNLYLTTIHGNHRREG